MQGRMWKIHLEIMILEGQGPCLRVALDTGVGGGAPFSLGVNLPALRMPGVKGQRGKGYSRRHAERQQKEPGQMVCWRWLGMSRGELISGA